jgi:peptidoglycan/xylan/chitin deacetylase (PgdA/CDA1 family)
MITWPNAAKAAVSLSFDDARLSQADRGIAFLDSLKVPATFYVTIASMMQRLEAWKRAAAAGHEIGNHSMTHPCSGNFEWARKNALEDYTLERMAADIEQADVEIHRHLGLRATTFAYPCGQTFVGRGERTQSYVPLVARRFKIGRAYASTMSNDPQVFDPAQALAVISDCKTFEELERDLETTLARGGWLILAGHEMAEQNAFQTTLLSTIEAIARYCREKNIWLDTVDRVGTHILEQSRC